MAQEIAKAVTDYEEALQRLTAEAGDEGIAAEAVMACLISRDAVQKAVSGDGQPTPATLVQLAALDADLRAQAGHIAKAVDLSAWRKTVQPKPEQWWWRLDETQAKAEEERDLPWVLLAATLMTVTLGLAVEIIRRMWSGGPDPFSVVSALLTLALTGSPLTKQGRELAKWLMDKVHLPTRYRGETMMGAACLAFIVTLLLHLALPAVAVACNNRGYALLQAGDLTGAQRAFARAVSINPDYAAGYYNLADAYLEIGDDEQAFSLYKQALAADRTLDLAYNGLGYVLILQGKPWRAISVLYTGLSLARDDEARYIIHKNLGWAYYQTDQYDLAQDQLETAVTIRSDQAPAYYYLALTYEALKEPRAAIAAWENCLRYIDYDDPEESGWAPVARAHLQKLREETP